MADTVVTLTPRQVEAARELQDILAEEKQLAQRKDAAKAILAEALTEPGQQAVDADGVVWVTMRAGSMRFDAEEARRNLDPKLLTLIVREVPDPALAKELLPRSVYEKCCKQTAPSIQAGK